MILFGGVAFVWLTALLIRSMHHYLGIPFDLSLMLSDTRVQTAISILWTLIGMAGMLFASRREIRSLWIAAAGLVGVGVFRDDVDHASDGIWSASYPFSSSAAC